MNKLGKSENGFINQKKGLSDIIATVLIILLAIAAVAIVWSFISPTIRNTSGEVDLAQTCFNTEVKPLDCNVGVAGAGSATVQLARGDPSKIKEILLILEQGGGTTVVSRVNVEDAGVDLLETVSDDQSPGGGTAFPTITALDKLKAAAVVMDPNDDTRTRTCEVSLETIACA